MISDFQIHFHQNDDSLHLKLVGNFDEAAAHMLVDTLDKNHCRVHRIFVHTNGITAFNPSCQKLFRQDLLKRSNKGIDLIFTGKYGAHMAQEGAQVLRD